MGFGTYAIEARGILPFNIFRRRSDGILLGTALRDAGAESTIEMETENIRRLIWNERAPQLPESGSWKKDEPSECALSGTLENADFQLATSVTICGGSYADTSRQQYEPFLTINLTTLANSGIAGDRNKTRTSPTIEGRDA